LCVYKLYAGDHFLFAGKLLVFRVKENNMTQALRVFVDVMAY